MTVRPYYEDQVSASSVARSSDARPHHGRRISLQQLTVYLIFVEVFALIGLAFIPAIIERGADSWRGAIFDGREAAVFFTAVMFLVVARATGAYEARQALDVATSSRRLGMALAVTFVTLMVLGVATKTSDQYSRVWFFSWAALSCTLLPAHRLFTIAQTRKRLEQGDFVFKAVSAGLFREPLGPREITQTSQNMVRVHSSIRFDNYDEFDHLAATIIRDEIDQIYLVTPWSYAPHALEKLRGLRQLSAEVFVLPVDSRVDAHGLGVSTLGHQISLKSVDRPINGWDLWYKRAQDVVLASAILTFLLPFMGVIALVVKLDSPGPVLFRQKRVGFNGRQFELLKFRSMRAELADPDAEQQTGQGDPRVTRVGKFIRRTSLDELPQFFNVLKGNMSVVGPRPHALKTRAEGRELDEAADQYAARHRVKPGITGLSQVMGYRGELDSVEKLRKRVQFDIEYIETWSMWLDVKIMLRTAMLVVADKNAY